MNTTMTAAVLHGPRDIRLEDVPAPTPEAGQVLVRVQGVGLCGSDVHYYLDGRNGNNVVRSPAVLGHEIAGTIASVGSGVPREMQGRHVVIEPAASCGECTLCRSGRYNLCGAGWCVGSPPTAGGLARYVVAPADLVHEVPSTLAPIAAPLLEPLAVAVHALNRAGTVGGGHVLVSGGGPVGLLTAQVARERDAGSITLVDPVEERLQVGRDLGLDRAMTPDSIVGTFDLVLECSGAPAALGAALAHTRPGGRVVMVGTLPHGDVSLPAGLIQRYEVDVVGSFRYAHAFPDAVSLASSGGIVLEPLVTARFSLEEAARALDHAASGRGIKTVVQVPHEESADG